ncbi:hypothetical protein GCM10025881_15990 [Pseudolysinimonas kribbensis]|uniref:Amidohydrolase 3 domain-containing protein n=1 Tax=Pseudolysinimonas kribbensis TaxID=433641 RepID=A0ABQ6K5B3_9MICO|nr:amidohydrolase family protein [Pseudolysinimonas kribbensis]GMA94775.1 hypothetical protein GCM10025881_15990 [Pseudolysinimonas kribbensis]
MTSTAARTALVGGSVADGSGAEARSADVLLSGGRVEAVVPLGERPAGGYDAALVDCAGRIVAPGFVDVHCHSDITLLAYPGNASRVTQGVTTEVVGNCGMSPAPGNADPEGLAGIIATIDVTPDVPWAWSDVAGWLRALDEAETATNVAAQVGHGSARFAVAGTAARPLDDAELDALEAELEAAFEAGVVGASVGLMYAPGSRRPRPSSTGSPSWSRATTVSCRRICASTCRAWSPRRSTRSRGRRVARVRACRSRT